MHGDYGGYMIVAWGLPGGCMVVAWWLHNGYMTVTDGYTMVT